MPGRGLIATGAVGAILAAICCATPLLAVVLGAVGLSAWLAGADYVVFAVLVAGMGLIGLGLYRRHAESQRSRPLTNNKAPT
jgi:mercuric ion transport protein